MYFFVWKVVWAIFRISYVLVPVSAISIRDNGPDLTAIFLQPRLKARNFDDRSIPSLTLLIKSSTSGFTQRLRLHSRSKDFHEPRVIMYSSAGRTLREANIDVNSSAQVTYYITPSDHNIQMAAAVEEIIHTDGRLRRKLRDGTVMIMDGGWFTLQQEASNSKRDKRGNNLDDDLWNLRYKVKRITGQPYKEHSFHAPQTPYIKRLNKKGIPIRVCIHTDFDFYVTKKKSISAGVEHVKDLVNKMQTVYNKLGADYKYFPYHLKLELTKIIIETDLYADPLGLRDTPNTQTEFNGFVYENIISAHDLLTLWLSKHHEPECDHYMLHTGTISADFVSYADEQGYTIYKSGKLGLAWDRGMCIPGAPYKRCSVTQDIDRLNFVTCSHELAHNLGASHDQVCPTKFTRAGGRLMDQGLHHSMSLDTIKWSRCSTTDVYHWLKFAIGVCLFPYQAKPSLSASSKYKVVYLEKPTKKSTG